MNDQVNPTIAKKMFTLDTTPILDEVFEGFNKIFSKPTLETEPCPTYGGDRRVIDQKRINSTSVDVPYTWCQSCNGTGIKC
jgi:hypothetical protein